LLTFVHDTLTLVWFWLLECTDFCGNLQTPDFLIKGKVWELKSPTGTGKNNIQRQLQEAHNQSVNVILDASRSKMHPLEIKRRAEHQFKIVKSVKRLIFVPKDGEPLEIKR
jgi:hypothetical protein